MDTSSPMLMSMTSMKKIWTQRRLKNLPTNLRTKMLTLYKTNLPNNKSNLHNNNLKVNLLLQQNQHNHKRMLNKNQFHNNKSKSFLLLKSPNSSMMMKISMRKLLMMRKSINLMGMMMRMTVRMMVKMMVMNLRLTMRISKMETMPVRMKKKLMTMRMKKKVMMMKMMRKRLMVNQNIYVFRGPQKITQR